MIRTGVLIAVLAAVLVMSGRPAVNGMPVTGVAEVTSAVFVEMIYHNNPNPELMCPVEEWVGYYYDEAGLYGIRPDLAISQALLETGFLRYGNDVYPWQNNFCGLGATGNGNPGHHFYSPRLGVRAHIQHMAAYLGMEVPDGQPVDPRYGLVAARTGQPVDDWEDLARGWAADPDYAQKVISVLERALAMAGVGNGTTVTEGAADWGRPVQQEQ
ncbi:MAG: glucosaminidase domain-containing protein [Negativicutes bacterium]|nr:glucosaminidase domain-containing protein [Negativicutes bacterium]